MKRVVVTLTMCLLVFSTPSFAAILNFDDLRGGGTKLDSYNGFSWGNFYSYFYDNYNLGYHNTLSPVSATAFIYNGCGTQSAMSITSTSNFIFNGAYLTGWANANNEWYANAHSVTINGYLSGNKVSTYVANLNLGRMNYFATGWSTPVDKLVFTSDGNNKWFLMDNFTYNQTPVPVPSTALLLGPCLVAIVLWRRMHT